ncbi:MAG: translation factor Sua5 [Rhizobacter sp.]|nr:translation factor Sua5 [Rhizobacter sp.]
MKASPVANPHRAPLPGDQPEAIAQAAQALARGELVGFPTETVYGLGGRADDDAAVAKIFAAKGRPSDHPLIVHVATAAAAEAFASHMPEVARRLMAAFWPGPLTVIVPRAPDMGRAAAGGQDSVGLRCPSHPVAQALLAAAHGLGVAGVAAPSANRFGRVSPTHAEHVVDEFAAWQPPLLVLDGGPCDVGIESAIVDCSQGAPVLLRPGVLTREAIEAAAGEPLQDRNAQSPRASGTLESHYAPDARVVLMDTAQLMAALRAWPAVTAGHRRTPSATTAPQRLAVYSRTQPPVLHSAVLYRRMPHQPLLAAQELFAVLREFDAAGVQLIWIEALPPDPEWDGVRDRVQRASAR